MSIPAIPGQEIDAPWLMQRRPPGQAFFATFTQAYATLQTPSLQSAGQGGTQEAGQRLLAGLLGQTHADMSRRRGVSLEDQAAYAGILERAYTSGGMLDPVGFLRGLSPAELGVVQRNHALGLPIRPEALGREGASNLLLPEGYAYDLNGDDLIDRGNAQLIQFPPTGAPPAFTKAWQAATQDLNPGDAASYGLAMFTAMHTVPVGDRTMGQRLPGDDLSNYRQVAQDYLAMLEGFRAHLAQGQYERDKAFFGRLLSAMG